MKRKALSHKHSPRSLRIWWFVTLWLLMDRINPASWIWGVVGTLAAIIAIVSVIDFFSAEDVEI